MQQLAQRLMAQQIVRSSALPTAIFGTAGSIARTIDLEKPMYRLGLWPVVGKTAPYIALGLGNLSGYLLEQYRDIRVYRLLIDLEGEPDDFKWDISRSQFDVDDWNLDDLDENIALWGQLTQADQWTLSIWVENDLLVDEQPGLFTATASEIGQLVIEACGLAEQIAAYIGLDMKRLVRPELPELAMGEIAALKHIFMLATDIEVKIMLALWGQPWEEAEILRAMSELAHVESRDRVGAWIIGNVARRLLASPGLLLDPGAEQLATDLADTFNDAPVITMALAPALFNRGQTQAAYDLLEAALEQHPRQVQLRLGLAELYRTGRRLDEALGIFQEAIEQEVVSPMLFNRYADLLIALDYNEIILEDFALIDPSQFRASPLIWEAIAAYEESLKIDPDDIVALYGQSLQLIELNSQHERLWQRFTRLVQLDQRGDRIRTLADALYSLEDITPAISALKAAAQQNPQRVDLWVNLAITYINADQRDLAISTLEYAEQLTDQEDQLADIERLLLIAEDPDVEAHLGELTDIINAGNSISAEDMEFLEDVLERAPSYGEAYLLVARAYLEWGEMADAGEILLDGHRQIPDDAEITQLLAETLWDAGERDTALGYVNKGLERSPNHVPLLAVLGQFLFDLDDIDSARQHLARAELLAPRDATLTRVKAYIASQMG